MVKASLAISGDMSPISKRIRPGFTGARYISTPHFPPPIGVSRAFLVYGLSGKIRIQSCPHFLRKRTIALRALSICRDVM
jgi:hypothetical protein